jgi:hypothetical protein
VTGKGNSKALMEGGSATRGGSTIEGESTMVGESVIEISGDGRIFSLVVWSDVMLCG